MHQKEPPMMSPHEGSEPHADHSGGHHVSKHGHTASGSHGFVPHAGHGLHPDHPMLHHDGFHKNEHHG